MSLILSISQKDAQNPYRFKLTNINVYSLEEALFHCFHWWKKSIDDFTSEEFISWVNNDLGLSRISMQISEIASISDFSSRLIEFLSIVEYFDDSDLSSLKSDLVLWENRLEWEKYKERADQLIDSQPHQAYSLYKRALQYGKNVALLNNIGIALMKSGTYGEAVFYLEQAVLESGAQNFDVLTNLAEAYILNGSTEHAEELIKDLEVFGETDSLYYLKGEFAFTSGDYRNALDYYEKAVALNQDAHYVYRITDVYIKLRSYDKAIDYLNLLQDKGVKLLVKMAEVYMHYKNLPAAVKCIKAALDEDHGSVELWTKLALYNRLNYDLDEAHDAINNAIELEPDNERANLELARIKKAQGKTKDYQDVLHSILNKFKNMERDKYLYS